MKENELKARLARYRQIKMRVIGRKSGKTISIPVWFVLEGEKLYLLPVQGSEAPQTEPAVLGPSLWVQGGQDYRERVNSAESG